MGDGAEDAKNREEMEELKNLDKKTVPKELYIEAKRSYNFQTYTCGILLDLGDLDKRDESHLATTINYWQARCRAACNAQIKLDVS